MKRYMALAVMCFLLAAPTARALPLEATAIKVFPAMKTEAAFTKLLQLLNKDEVTAAAEYLKTEGLLLRDGTEVILTEVGCDGLCVKFRVKGEDKEYWTVPTMDGGKVFKFKK
ncbi:MAG TPA: hypothetical protein VK463_02975 [Desulfomonilaceae bacterium]|nr:hypothetical protein [Desulfomonilaceae bacterium]